MEPTLENLASGRYPLEKSIRLVYRRPLRRACGGSSPSSPRRAGRALLRDLGALPVDFPPAE